MVENITLYCIAYSFNFIITCNQFVTRQSRTPLEAAGDSKYCLLDGADRY